MSAEPATERSGWRSEPFRLGDFVVDARRNRIAGPEGETALQPMVIDVLCVLAGRHGEVLSRSDLIDAVWGKEFGADESLTRAISLLRKVFGDTRDEPRVIETIAKRGYRLIVRPVPVALPPSVEATVPASSASRGRRLWRWIAGAVLAAAVILAGALALHSGSDDEPVRSERTGLVVIVERFGSDAADLTVEGLADELSTAIARSPLLRVATRDAPAPAGGIRYRLRGDIRRVAGTVRVNAQLLDAATGEVVWGERYDQPYDPQFSAREAVVAAITRDTFYPLLRAAKVRLLRRPIRSLVPWELTLLVTWVPGDERMFAGPPTESAYWLQNRALEFDPDFAPAHALFAQLASWHALFDPPSDTPAKRARARGHAERAIELAPYDAEVLYQLALHYQASGDRERALAMLDRVLVLQPNHPLAPIDRAFVAGQCGPGSGAAVARLTREIETLPVSSPARWVALSHLSSLHLARGEFAEARDAALASRQIVPSARTAMTLAVAEVELGRADGARAVLAEHRREWPNLDFGYFAEQVVPRWCLGGPASAAAQASFGKLAGLFAPAA